MTICEACEKVKAERDAARREERMRAADHAKAWRRVAEVEAKLERATALADEREGREFPGTPQYAAVASDLRAALGTDQWHTLPRAAKPKMVMRSLRVSEKLWEAAKAKAGENEENISDVLREALERYVKRK